MKPTSALRGVVLRIALILFCAVTLANCSSGSIPPTHHPAAPSGTAANPHSVPLPVGAHIDSQGDPIDAYGRYLIYVGGADPWRSIDHGIAIDPSLRAAPASAIRAAAQAATSTRRRFDMTPPVSQDNCPWLFLAYKQPSLMLSCNAIGSDTAGALMSVAGIPQGTLRFQIDGFWYDDAHDEWAYDMKSQQWLKTIVSVVSRPSQSEYYPYYVAYDFIGSKTMERLWWTFALPVPEGLVPLQSLAERFGVRGAVEVSEKLIGDTFEKLAAQLGSDNLLRMSDVEGNTLMALRGYTKPPFLVGKQVAQFTVNESMLGGKVAGSQLVRFASKKADVAAGRWLTTMDQVTNADGTMMSAREIADLLALPEAPRWYAPVAAVEPGTTLVVGVANDMKVYGWGSGGAIQYFLESGSFEIGNPSALQY